MSAPQRGTREIARGFVEALRPALRPASTTLERVAARDVAQIMDLPGLDAVLAELDRLPGPGRPRELEHVVERVSRLADVVERTGDIEGFRAADRELAALAGSLAQTDWREPAAARGPAVATLTVEEMLADLTLEAPAEALHSRVTMTVASAVRAAIDWLGADESATVRADVHDSALTLSVGVGHAGGIGPAGAVLAAVEGSLGRESEARWSIRVPRLVDRPSYLLLKQGRYGFALPWHAVARLRMFPQHELERLEEARLDPLVRLQPTSGERPAALVALGLARAWFVADRVVWRIAARPEESETAAPFPGVTMSVEMDNGARFWVLEPAWLLRGVAPPEVAPPSPRPRAGLRAPESPPSPAGDAPAERAVSHESAPPSAAEALAEAVERALEQLKSERPQAPSPPAEAAPAPESRVVDARLEVLHPEPAAPAEPPAATVSEPPAAGPAPAPESAVHAVEAPGSSVDAPAARAAPVPKPARRRALVADDSLVARIFLARLLEKRGWIVELVGDAASLWAELAHGPWGLVCADIALPDAPGSAHVTQLVDRFRGNPAAPWLVVLTRDAQDEREARGAGAAFVLRKPFEPERLDAILPR